MIYQQITYITIDCTVQKTNTAYLIFTHANEQYVYCFPETGFL